MEKRTNVQDLMKISEPKLFKQREYICSEGEEGEEMYIVLQGKVAVYISSFLDNEVKIAEVGPGEFFGEMAIFEKKVRSASCVAVEDTSCIAIRDSNLKELIVLCPEIIEKLLYGLSQRVREMNDKLYKSETEAENVKILPFTIPQMHQSVPVRENTDRRYLNPIRVVCPLCGSHIVAQNINYQKLKVMKVRYDQRKIFDRTDVMWHFMRSCPDCGYTNFYVNFGLTQDMPIEQARKAVKEENEYFARQDKLVNKFDSVASRYYKAIHFNECIHREDSFLLGKLWLYLYWLYEDVENAAMMKYCAEKVMLYYGSTYEENRNLLKREIEKQQCAMVIAEMHYFRKEYADAKKYYHEVMNYSNSNVYDQAYERICELRRAEKRS